MAAPRQRRAPRRALWGALLLAWAVLAARAALADPGQERDRPRGEERGAADQREQALQDDTRQLPLWLDQHARPPPRCPEEKMRRQELCVSLMSKVAANMPGGPLDTRYNLVDRKLKEEAWVETEQELRRGVRSEAAKLGASHLVDTEEKLFRFTAGLFENVHRRTFCYYHLGHHEDPELSEVERFGCLTRNPYGPICVFMHGAGQSGPDGDGGNPNGKSVLAAAEAAVAEKRKRALTFDSWDTRHLQQDSLRMKQKVNIMGFSPKPHDYWGKAAGLMLAYELCEPIMTFWDMRWAGWESNALQRLSCQVIQRYRPIAVFAHSLANLVLAAGIARELPGCTDDRIYRGGRTRSSIPPHVTAFKTHWFGVAPPLKGSPLIDFGVALCEDRCSEVLDNVTALVKNERKGSLTMTDRMVRTPAKLLCPLLRSLAESQCICTTDNGKMILYPWIKYLTQGAVLNPREQGYSPNEKFTPQLACEGPAAEMKNAPPCKSLWQIAREYMDGEMCGSDASSMMDGGYYDKLCKPGPRSNGDEDLLVNQGHLSAVMLEEQEEAAGLADLRFLAAVFLDEGEAVSVQSKREQWEWLERQWNSLTKAVRDKVRGLRDSWERFVSEIGCKLNVENLKSITRGRLLALTAWLLGPYWGNKDNIIDPPRSGNDGMVPLHSCMVSAPGPQSTASLWEDSHSGSDFYVVSANHAEIRCDYSTIDFTVDLTFDREPCNWFINRAFSLRCRMRRTYLASERPTWMEYARANIKIAKNIPEVLGWMYPGCAADTATIDLDKALWEASNRTRQLPLDNLLGPGATARAEQVSTNSRQRQALGPAQKERGESRRASTTTAESRELREGEEQRDTPALLQVAAGASVSEQLHAIEQQHFTEMEGEFNLPGDVLFQLMEFLDDHFGDALRKTGDPASSSSSSSESSSSTTAEEEKKREIESDNEDTPPLLNMDDTELDGNITQVIAQDMKDERVEVEEEKESARRDAKSGRVRAFHISLTRLKRRGIVILSDFTAGADFYHQYEKCVASLWANEYDRPIVRMLLVPKGVDLKVAAEEMVRSGSINVETPVVLRVEGPDSRYSDMTPTELNSEKRWPGEQGLEELLFRGDRDCLRSLLRRLRTDDDTDADINGVDANSAWEEDMFRTGLAQFRVRCSTGEQEVARLAYSARLRWQQKNPEAAMELAHQQMLQQQEGTKRKRGFWGRLAFWRTSPKAEAAEATKATGQSEPWREEMRFTHKNWRGLTSCRFKAGIVGGMGCLAGASFLKDAVRLVKYIHYQDKDKGLCIEVFSNPQFAAKVLQLARPSTWGMMSRFIRLLREFLDRRDIDTFAGPCNTWHQNMYYRMTKYWSLGRQINMVAEVSRLIVGLQKYDIVGLMGTLATMAHANTEKPQTTLLFGNLYVSEWYKANLEVKKALEEKHEGNTYKNIRLIGPSTAALEMKSQQGIWKAKEGRLMDANPLFMDVAVDLRNHGATAVIAGCTEIPLALSKREAALLGMHGYFDSAAILGETLMRRIQDGRNETWEPTQTAWEMFVEEAKGYARTKWKVWFE